MTKKRGGKRPGAGAPKGNKNALSSGFRSRDPKFLAWWHSLTPEQQDFARPLMRKHGSDVLSAAAELAATQALEDEGIVVLESRRGGDAGGRLLAKSPLYTHTHNQQSTNNQATIPMQVRLDELVRALKDYGCYQATVFVEQHRDGLETMERALEEFRELEEHHPDQLIGLVSRGAFLKKEMHEALMERIGQVVQCRHCGAVKRYVLSRPRPAAAEGGA